MSHRTVQRPENSLGRVTTFSDLSDSKPKAVQNKKLIFYSNQKYTRNYGKTDIIVMTTRLRPPWIMSGQGVYANKVRVSVIPRGRKKSSSFLKRWRFKCFWTRRHPVVGVRRNKWVVERRKRFNCLFAE